MSKVKANFKDSRFSYEGLISISRAGAGLFKWVAAMVNYHAVAKTVEPKRKKVAEAEKSLRIASKDLAKTQEDVARLNAELESLNKSFLEKSTEQQELKEKADLMERRLTAASKLIDGLSSERSRWTADMQTLDEKKVRICFLTPAFRLAVCDRVCGALSGTVCVSRQIPCRCLLGQRGSTWHSLMRPANTFANAQCMCPNSPAKHGKISTESCIFPTTDFCLACAGSPRWRLPACVCVPFLRWLFHLGVPEGHGVRIVAL